MNIHRIFSMETNLRLKNLKDFVFQKKYTVNRSDKQSICFYLDAATYNNLGDQAISLAIEWFLRDEFGKEHVRVVNESDLIKYIRSLKKQITADDIIVLGGGGNMGDIYPRYESLRRLVVEAFPKNKIIIFPQTIDYSDDAYGHKEFEKAKKIYGAHRSLILCARENRSFEIFNGFCKNVLLVPDIVLYLMDKISPTAKGSGKVGICLREDKESALSVVERHDLIDSLDESNLNFEVVTTMSTQTETYLNFDSRERAVQRKIDEFSQYKFVITDRLHGMIFSILAKTPCVALDNCNHKVFGVYKTIEDKCNDIVMISQFADVMDDIKKAGCKIKAEVSVNPERDLFYELAGCLIGSK